MPFASMEEEIDHHDSCVFKGYKVNGHTIVEHLLFDVDDVVESEWMYLWL